MVKPIYKLLLSFSALALASCTPAPQPEVQGPDGAVFRRMTVERLPELNAPRGGHRTLLLGEELTVIGGHTDGFKLIETAEYLHGGVWHEVPLVYPHDGGFTAPLPDGTVLVGGGSAEPFGIGQSWGVEVYDPVSHSSRAVGILDRKRAYASALTLPDGRVVIAGNWHAEDAVEVWDPVKGFSFAGEVSLPRERPRILPAGPEEVLIFGGRGQDGKGTEAIVDRLSGTPFREPLLEEWAPEVDFLYSDTDGKIGEDAYLLPALRRSDGEPGILRVSGGAFSLLELERPLPRLGPGGETIHWWGGLQTDRSRRQAWMQGPGAEGRLYFARISYDATFEGGAASVDLFYAERPGGGPFPIDPVVLLSGGRLAKIGGKWPDPQSADLSAEANFATSREAYILHSEPIQRTGAPAWAWLTGLLVLGGLATVAALRKKKPEPAGEAEPGPAGHPSLAEQISRLIEEEQLYKRKDLRVADVAAALATNKTYVSTMINNISGQSFSDLINGHRVRHAQALMREHPEMPLADVADESGFSSPTTFRRNFKALTGVNPSEWKERGR